MEDLGSFFILTAVLLCLLLGVLLVRFNKEKKLQTYVLALLFFIMAWFGFIYILISSKTLIKVPFLFRFGLPFYYLMPPLTLIYTQMVIKGNDNIRKEVLLLHAVPFLVGLLDLTVYYYRHWQDLGRLVLAIYQEPSALFFKGAGFIPAVFHYGFRPIQGCIYMAMTLTLLIGAYRQKKLMRLKRSHRDWLIILVLFMTVYYGNNFYYTFINPLVDFIAISRTLMVASFFGGCFCLVVIKLFFSPWIIYPIVEPEPPAILDEAQKVATITDEHAIEETTRTELLSADRVATLAADMQRVMNEEQLFKSVNRISDLANRLETSPRYISYVLSNHYRLRFNDFLNMFRIDFVIQEIIAGKGEHFTLESIAFEAGFTSRSTFYTAFKKQTGLSPNQYLQNIRNSPDD